MLHRDSFLFVLLFCINFFKAFAFWLNYYNSKSVTLLNLSQGAMLVVNIGNVC